MAKKRITDSLLENLVRQPPKNRVEYSDRRCPGLIVRANRTGKATFTVVYRVSGGKLRRYTIGDWPDTDLSTARAEALRIVDEARTGRDEQLKKLEQAGETFRLAWDEYVNKHLKHAATRSWQNADGFATRHLFPRIGEESIRSLSRAKLNDIITEVRNDVGVGTAREIRRYLSSFYN